MARKTYRPDDICFLFSSLDQEAGVSSVGEWLDAKRMSRGAMKKLFEEKLVLLNGKKTNPKATVTIGDELRLQMPKEKLDHEPIGMDLDVLYEDEDLLVLHKPVGITVNSEGQVSLANGVAQYFKEQGIKRKVRFLNRLDRDTSGCIVIAKSAVAQAFYQQQMEEQIFEKWYHTKVEGLLEGTRIIELPMKRGDDGIHQVVSEDGKMTRTAYKAEAVYRLEPIGEGWLERKVEEQELSDLNDEVKAQLITHVDIRLYTGKTHQIRVTMAHLGHPLVGDALYGHKLPGQTYSLVAKRIVFTSLRTGQVVVVEANCNREDTN
ncbi:RluA family pseudouridine synthase [uncultured Veillonella sp.]|uniref:RluA family pseudouridine synthase n=1 Tax=uncultured Veillonella sp. TaxID=159268 RepID=UPI0026236D16|nr:RluA family pseudouridine synthase [uncultured Veillonella sp.]